MATRQISPQQRAMNFGAYTRQHFQTLGTQKGTAGSHFEFEVPKARLLQAINLMVEVELAGEITDGIEISKYDLMELYNVIERVAINYNNGFSPVTASGKEIAILNMLRINSASVLPSIDADSTLCTIVNEENVSSSATGEYKFTNNGALKYYFNLEIPVTLNERDTAGLILAQNASSLINVIGDIRNVLTISGDELTVSNVSITPQLVTFSIPPVESAFPDLSVLRVVDSRTESFLGGGSNLIKLPTGMIYRKLILYFEDENGQPMSADDITSNIEILLNTADIPYSVNPKQLRMRTTSMIGGTLPRGYFAFDWSYQGIPNLGGSRDYVDAESITSLECRFTTSKKGKVTIISEKISRLKASK